MSDTVNAGMLRSFVERIERVEEEIKELNAGKSDIYKELRGFGFDVKAVRAVVAKRKLDTHEREEREAIFDLYWSALHGGSHVHVHTHVENIEQFDAETGEITEQPETAPNFTGPQPLAVSGGEPSIPSSDDGGAKTESDANRDPGRSDDQSARKNTQSEQAANSIPKAPTSRPESAVNPADDLVTPATEKSGLAEPALNRSSAPAANTKSAPIPDDDFTPPAFIAKDRAERNERCEQPLTCKFGHHPQKITCSTCSTAWQIAQRKARAA